jgi:ABC-type branched-subunit amino acid transport system substrate-binding protein
MFAAYGSVIDNTTAEPEDAYLAKKLHAKSVAVVAYKISASSDACNDAVLGFKKYGLNVTYTDTNIDFFNINLTPDIQRMRQQNVDFVLSCMDVNGNIDLARGMQQAGLGNANQEWFNGQDQSTINQYSSLMQHVYFGLEHVPFSAATRDKGVYPGLQNYITAMNKYEPASTYEEVALEGWLSAELFVAGVKAAGPNLTQAKVVAADNALSSFTGNGLATPVNWKTAHTIATPPYCVAYAKVIGKQLLTVIAPGHQVFTCFSRNPKQAVPISPPAGVPGA